MNSLASDRQAAQRKRQLLARPASRRDAGATAEEGLEGALRGLAATFQVGSPLPHFVTKVLVASTGGGRAGGDHAALWATCG
jgi:hypothetical protein